MKKLYVLLLAALILALASCADASVSYSLTDDNAVSVDYKMTLRPEEEKVSSYISLISKHWADLGFSTENSEDEGVYTLTGTKTIACDSRSSAAAQLSAVLTDEDSLFYDAEFIYTPSYFEDNYIFSASISLKDIIRKNEEDTIPVTEVESMIDSAHQGEYRLTITLPGDVVSTNADERSGQSCSWLLKYGEERRIEITAKSVFEEAIAHYDTLKETQSRDNMLFLVCAASAGVLLLVIIIVIIVRRKRARASEISIERF